MAGAIALAVAVAVVSVILANSRGSSDSNDSEDQPAEGSAVTPTKTLSKAGAQIEFGSDGKTLATDDGQTVRLWSGGMTKPDVTLDEQRLRGFSPDGKIVATQGGGGTTDGVEVRLRNVATGKTVGIHASGYNVVTAFSTDSKTLATASTVVAEESGRAVPVQVWNVADGTLRATLTGHINGVGSMAFTPDGTLVTASTDHTVRLWNVTTKKATKILGDSDDFAVYDMALSPDGKVIATWAGDKRPVRLWNTATGALITTRSALKPGGVFSPDSKFFAYADTYGVELWNVTAGKVAKILDGGGPLRFSPDSKTLAAGTWHTPSMVVLWDVSTGKESDVLPVPGRTDALTDLAFREDGRTLATADAKGTVRLWDISSLS